MMRLAAAALILAPALTLAMPGIPRSGLPRQMDTDLKVKQALLRAAGLSEVKALDLTMAATLTAARPAGARSAKHTQTGHGLFCLWPSLTAAAAVRTLAPGSCAPAGAFRRARPAAASSWLSLTAAAVRCALCVFIFCMLSLYADARILQEVTSGPPAHYVTQDQDHFDNTNENSEQASADPAASPRAAAAQPEPPSRISPAGR